MVNIQRMKKTVVVFGLSGFLFVVPMTASASIPVIDDQNILQQLKTYMESIKIVTNTAQQIALQLKELESLPEKVLQSYKDAFQASVEKITQATKAGGILADEGDWRVWWNEVFPSVKQGEATFLAERSIDASIQEVLSMQNQKNVESYHALMKELEESKKRLADLLELNKTPEGQKQAVQISNQIAAEKAHIETINTSIQAIAVQNQAMKNQAEVTKEKHQQAAAEASAKASDTTIDAWHKELQAEWTAPAIDDPWAKYGGYKGW